MIRQALVILTVLAILIASCGKKGPPTLKGMTDNITKTDNVTRPEER